MEVMCANNVVSDDLDLLLLSNFFGDKMKLSILNKWIY